MNALAISTQEMLKWKSIGPRRDSGNIILLPWILDHFQLQHPVSSPYVAKCLKGGPDVIWLCLTNFISKALLKSIFSFHMLNTIALVQSHILLSWTNTRPSEQVPLTLSTYISHPDTTLTYIHHIAEWPAKYTYLIISLQNFERFWIHSFHLLPNANKTKRQLTVWERIFTNDTFNKGLISTMYKELIQLTPKQK